MFTQKVRDETRLAEELASNVADACLARDVGGILAALSGAGGERALVLDEMGVVQADTMSLDNGTRFARAEAVRVLAGEASAFGYYNVPSTLGFWQTLRAVLFRADASATTGLYASAIEGARGRCGVLVLITGAQDVYDSLSGMLRKMLGWMLLAAAGVIAASILLSRMFTRPIDALGVGISRMTRGDFASRVTVRGHNEFSKLATAFNMMCERIESLDRSRSQFVSNASHELKTPLSTMKILIETLLYQDKPDEGMQKEFLGDVNKEIDRLNAVVNDLLTLVNMDAADRAKRFAPVALADVLSETASRLAPFAREHGVSIDCVARDTPVVLGDAGQLAQVTYNLVDNAVKYTPRGGSVRAELSRSGRKAVLKVVDTGIGIPKKDLPLVFERFYRVDKARSRETGGTGLGLSIVKQIVSLHGGEVRVASEEGKGSTFVVELPIA